MASESGAVETGDRGRPCVVDAVAGLQEGADAGEHGFGAGPVGRLLVAVAPPDDAGGQLDAEFRTELVAELARRYLRAVRAHRGDQAAMLLRAHIETSQAEVRKITLHQMHMARRGGQGA